MPSASVTASATPTQPTAASTYPVDVPEAAKADTSAGAVAFTKYFFEQVKRAYAEPRAGLLTPLHTPQCESCAAYERNAQRFVDQRLHFDQQPLEFVEVSLASDVGAGARYSVDVVLHQLPARLLDSSGAVVDSLRERRAVLVADLVRLGDRWFLGGVQVRS